ncbi:hypothetical protein QZH41_016160, partial [Actinostola sp. cb2023]
VLAAARSTKENQSGCHNSDVILDCRYFADINVKSADLQWRVKDNVAHKWKKIASIRRGNRRLFPNSNFDDRITLHTNGSLEIKSLKPNDATLYQCKVSQIGKRDTHFIELSVMCDGQISVTKREVCVEDDVLLDCQAKHRTNPLHLKRVTWHKKNAGSSWSLVIASDRLKTRLNGTKLHTNGSLLLPAGRQESEMKYKCDVSKNIRLSPRERHIVIIKNVKCRRTKRAIATIKTTKGRVVMTTSTPIQGTTVAMETTRVSVQQTAATTQATAQPGTQTTKRDVTPTKSHGCGGTLTAPTGGFQSPNFPSAYPANSYCKWTISVPQDYAAIDIKLDQMNLEYEESCQNDYIAIHDELGNQVGCRRCGAYTKPIEFQVRGRVAVIEFNSDSTVHKTGFKLTYKGAKAVGKSDP